MKIIIVVTTTMMGTKVLASRDLHRWTTTTAGILIDKCTIIMRTLRPQYSTLTLGVSTIVAPPLETTDRPLCTPYVRYYNIARLHLIISLSTFCDFYLLLYRS